MFKQMFSKNLNEYMFRDENNSNEFFIYSINFI
jgi:hypothetical protein